MLVADRTEAEVNKRISAYKCASGCVFEARRGMARLS